MPSLRLAGLLHGRTERCHKGAPPLPDSCQRCDAWGLFKSTGGTCDACRDWARRHPGEAPCISCGRTASLNPAEECRLCWRRSRSWARDPADPDRLEAVTGGHQLFFHGMEQRLALLAPSHRRPPPQRFRTRRTRSRRRPVLRPIAPVVHCQLVLFDARRDYGRLRTLTVPDPVMPELLESLEAKCLDLGEQRGWTRDLTGAVNRALKVLLATQDTPGRPVDATRVAMIRELALPVRPTIEVLDHACFLTDDRSPAVTAWVERKTAHLPAQIRSEIAEWADVMQNGSTVTPRRHPRSHRTTRNHLYAALPALDFWATTRQSLREVTRDDVVAVLPVGGTDRSEMASSLRSIFQVLHARRRVFTNPTTRMKVGMPEPRTPVSMDVPMLRHLVNDSDPARAACGTLLIFHGLRPVQLRTLSVTDVIDGRLAIEGRKILLAPQARAALKGYLIYREQKWPNSGNPHLFINQATAGHLTPVTGKWINKVLGTSAQALREDRILDEAQASEGDARRLADLFGLTVNAAQRYTATVDHVSFAEHNKRTGQATTP
ncbi:hypothetical protein ACIA8I_41540 [Streptomyces rishiriensis]|uniref:hypothetical protein n=1 Tax=Streptomyces rishiriensis TaxID=68264 RepID=UPI00379FA409